MKWGARVLRRVAGAAWLVAALFSAGSARSQDPGIEVRRLLLDQAAYLATKKLEIVGEPRVESVARSTASNHVIQLTAGTQHAIAAVCTQDCDHVVIVLSDASGTQLASSRDRSPVVIVVGVPATSGPYTIKLSVPGCNRSACRAGFMVFRAGPVMPQQPAPPKFVEYRNYDLVGGDLERIRNVDEAECRVRCASNPLCLAYSFDGWNRWCFTKGMLTVLALDPRSTSAVREGLGTPRFSTATVVMERYRKRAFPTGGISVSSAGSFEDCEDRCNGDRTCVAFTFYKSSARCQVMTSTSEYFPDSMADSGAKRQKETP